MLSGLLGLSMGRVVQLLREAAVHDFADLWQAESVTRTVLRLLAAALLGGILGYQREISGKAAGLRTHMLVTVSATLIVVTAEQADFSSSDVSRVLQGLLAGIGFLGGGAILKSATDKEIQGLTTAAGIWLAAVIGICVGLGRIGTALLGTLLAFVILSAVGRLERMLASS
jgi:putative Mg2+ transporter-C (MgtC) family protein